MMSIIFTQKSHFQKLMILYKVLQKIDKREQYLQFI